MTEQLTPRWVGNSTEGVRKRVLNRSRRICSGVVKACRQLLYRTLRKGNESAFDCSQHSRPHRKSQLPPWLSDRGRLNPAFTDKHGSMAPAQGAVATDQVAADQVAATRELVACTPKTPLAGPRRGRRKPSLGRRHDKHGSFLDSHRNLHPGGGRRERDSLFASS
ncbi:hypothetical protein BH10PLA2_BH10PLA2_21900 [soil metagenome]